MQTSKTAQARTRMYSPQPQVSTDCPVLAPPRTSSPKSCSQAIPQACHASDGERTAYLLLHGLGELHEQSRWQTRHGHAQHAPQVGNTRAQEQRKARVVAGPSANSKAPHEEVAQCGAAFETVHLCACRLAFLAHHHVPVAPLREIVSGHTEDAL